jgi:hypothetical protein
LTRTLPSDAPPLVLAGFGREPPPPPHPPTPKRVGDALTGDAPAVVIQEDLRGTLVSEVPLPVLALAADARASAPELEVAEGDVDAEEAAALAAELESYTPPAAAAAVLPQAKSVAFPAPRAPKPAVSGHRPRAVWNALSPVAVLVVAAGLSFGGVRLYFGWHGSRGDDTEPVADEVTTASAAPSALRLPVAKSPAVPSAGPALTASDLALPPGVAVADGKGLLEVDTGGRHTIYVDGENQGLGPVRRFELGPGSHTVRILLGVEAREFTVTVPPGRRTRLGTGPGE